MSIVNKIESISSHLENAYGSLEDIGADLSHINKNIENLSIVLDTVYDSMPKINEEGTNLTLNNTRKGKMSNVLKGNLGQKTSILPSEYTQVDYIESSGTQYIDTSVNADSKLRVKIDMQYTDLSVSDNTNFGVIRSGSPNIRYHLMYQDAVFRFWTNDISINLSGINTNRHTFDLDVPNNIITVDSTQFEKISTAFDTQLNFWLFGRNSNYDSYKFYNSSKLYSCQMYYNNELVRDFIPCYRNSDNVVGLYDIVNDVFYTNQGTGDFTYGSVARIPNPDYPQDVEVVSGGNTINVCGKNLFDGILELGGYANGKKYSNNDNYRNANIIQVKPNTTYTFSINGTKQKYVLETYDLTQNFKHEILNNTGTFTTASDVYYINFRCYKGDFTSDYANLKVQLEEGDQPHQSQSYPINLGDIELCKIGDYQDRIYKDNGKWYIEKQIGKVVLNGSES